MGGLAILLIIALYLAVAMLVVRAVKGQKAKIAATIVIVLIPTADAILGRVYLKYLCETQGGPKIYRVVEDAKGFQWKGRIALNESDEGSKRFLNEFAAQFIESEPKPNGKVDRISLQNNKVVREKDVLPRSMYRILFVSSRYGPFSFYIRDQNIVETVEGDELIAVNTQFIFDGGWAEYLLSSFSDAGPGGAAWCKAPDSWEQLRDLVRGSLRSR